MGNDGRVVTSGEPLGSLSAQPLAERPALSSQPATLRIRGTARADPLRARALECLNIAFDRAFFVPMI
ncbi:hypothetical protein M1L21_43955 [Streptomyces sp. AS02]|nr:hypothetical protein [Streptomyces sp. AS02]MCL8017999.1 hypothetical protein [Streptomyces sp. AS02]